MCGGSDYSGGDFYVCYTKNNENQYKVPRVAIRMEGTSKIAEIRGVNSSQNLEEGFESIVEDKLKSMPFLSEENMKHYMQAVGDSKMLTYLNKKTGNKEILTIEEEKFLYECDREIVGFGWVRDPKIDSIRKNNLIKYKEVALKIMDQGSSILNYASEELKNDKKFMKEIKKLCFSRTNKNRKLNK